MAHDQEIHFMLEPIKYDSKSDRLRFLDMNAFTLHSHLFIVILKVHPKTHITVIQSM